MPAKRNRIKLKVYSTSGPSWQPLKNGKPYNKWVGTIQFSDTDHVMFGRRYNATISGKTKEEIINRLQNYYIGEIVSVNPDKVIDNRPKDTK